MEKVVFPVPVAVEPLLNVTVHAPVAVTLPVMFVEAPAQMVVLADVSVAVGRVFTERVVLPVNPAETAAQFASDKDESV